MPIPTNENCYRLLSTATMATLITKVAINVRTCSRKVPDTVCPILNVLDRLKKSLYKISWNFAEREEWTDGRTRRN